MTIKPSDGITDAQSGEGLFRGHIVGWRASEGRSPGVLPPGPECLSFFSAGCKFPQQLVCAEHMSMFRPTLWLLLIGVLLAFKLESDLLGLNPSLCIPNLSLTQLPGL